MFALLTGMSADAADPVAADSAAARALFIKSCSACHGSSGDGSGIAARSLKPPPADLTDAAHMATRTDEQLKQAITDGGSAAGLSASMPAFKSVLSAEEIDALVVWIRSLSPTKSEEVSP